ncbi:expressed unknown protein [Seminavis robusta]|uniref:Uncharacterized protein n=1 Tax=Seminavis robusta TaxID=568900 RepID=A0A9N8H5P1_9STRA|nr:expressed unknown protein [Seminavis robusta]|eukprot:Sro91_g047721.1  (88) ;mRNA; r:64727-64990
MLNCWMPIWASQRERESKFRKAASFVILYSSIDQSSRHSVSTGARNLGIASGQVLVTDISWFGSRCWSSGSSGNVQVGPARRGDWYH